MVRAAATDEAAIESTTTAVVTDQRTAHAFHHRHRILTSLPYSGRRRQSTDFPAEASPLQPDEFTSPGAGAAASRSLAAERLLEEFSRSASFDLGDGGRLVPA
jgi:hypothetical protein